MPDTENCGRIPRKIPKTWSVEVVAGVLGLMFESKYMKNAPMPEVIATNVENYCVVCNLVNYSLGLMTETDVSDIERNGEFAE